jgi:hypothetical protein
MATTVVMAMMVVLIVLIATRQARWMMHGVGARR